MANHKPLRAHADIEVLAAQWRAEWAPHDGIEPWLRRHLTELTTLVRANRWRWDDLASALNEACILYATGRPWSGRRLSIKVNTLRLRQRRASVALSPQDLIVTVREALGAAAGNFNTININLTSTVAPHSEYAVKPSPRRGTAVPLTGEATGSSQDDADGMKEESGFAFAQLKDWSPPVTRPAAADQPPPSDKARNRDVARVLQEFLSRPRRGSIPMPPLLEPEDE